MIWSIDGMEWDIPCTVERIAELQASDVSGLLLDKEYKNDVIGTFMQYEIAVACPPGMMGTYEALYEQLTQPIGGHQFVFPYNEDTIAITARVEMITDKWVRKDGGGNLWKGLRFRAIANHPSKTMSLNDVITIGLPPLPSTVDVPIGTTITMTGSGWQNIPDGDEVSY